MSTFAQMVDEVQMHLRSYVRDQELSTHLTDDMTASDTLMTVDDASVLSRGRVEIGDELIWINRVNREASTADIPPYGRGMDSTTAAVHAVGSRVITSPLYPRNMVKTVINQTIKSVGASLYGVKEETFTPELSFIYEMPADTRDVLTVYMTDSTEYGDVIYLRDWQLDKRAPSTVTTTGKALYIYDGAFRNPEQIVVSYSCDPLPLVNSDDTFSESLLPDTAEDVVILLAASRLLSTADAAASNTRAVEANALDSKIQPGGALQQSKYLLALGQQRLVEERLRLLNATANRSHYIR